jgi:hypothetical protein
MGRKTQHKFHGSQRRFDVVAVFVDQYFGNSIQYIADVAGGQGMLTKILNKRYGYEAEVIDPRESRIKGVPGQEREFVPSMADYYDLIIGLHPDEATRPVAEAALIRPALIVPCCNFWSEEKLGRDELVEAIETYYKAHDIDFRRIIFPFDGSKNIGILSDPTHGTLDHGPDADAIVSGIKKQISTM